jgi:16S rRNA (cytosine967-C5)-methyltransferase
MSRFHSYLNSAALILDEYKGNEPFASFLKKYFSANKKFGSKDRKQVSHLCYCYFRLGKAAMDLPVEERLLMALFLCSDTPNELLAAVKPEWNETTMLSTEEKLSLFTFHFSLQDVFPWKDELSDGINHEAFCQSFFIQPDVFLRLRPGHEAWVKEKLAKAGLSFNTINESCIALSQGSKIEDVLALDYEAVIQDLNSQQTGRFMQQAVNAVPLPFVAAWDCCAGSGGKSIMLFDIHEKLDLTVSDARETILKNLAKRFKEHEIHNYHAHVADLSKKTPWFAANSKFNFIVADVPCSGSGTWSRTPEQLYYFEESKIAEYAALQKRIVSNAVPALAQGGYFLYITCSVFKKENEEAVNYLKENLRLSLLKTEVLKGYDKKADSMFAALFQKSL